MHVIGVMLLLAFVSSCGKSNSNAGLPVEEEKILPVNGSNIDGLYMAKFFTLNPQINGSLPGSATIQRQGDKLFAYVRLFGGAPNAWHPQNIYSGKRCPNLGDDLNGDGIIDMEEGNKVWGEVLIPLDSNISSQAAGKNIFPIGDPTGTYFYERVTSFDSLFNDLKSTDKNLNDNIAKLNPEQGLDIEGRVVVIQGTADTVLIPETVKAEDKRSPHQSIPIACGVFSRVTEIPGHVESGEIPGPVETPTEPQPLPDPETEADDEWTTTDIEPESPQSVPQRPRRPRTDRDNDDDDRWYDRVAEWWRTRWDRARRGHETGWGNGLRDLF